MSKKALIVDDSKTARLVLQKMLETHELTVDNAESAEGALEYLGVNRPDIIFMDHEMPGMDGFEAVSAIKKNPATATIPIMMYTAQEGELYVGQARALGAVGVLPKQVEPVVLSKVLESLRVIGGDAQQREYFDEADDKLASGEYPSLEKFDQDLGILIQELFDQQRAILRRDLRDSQETIAARVVDEIKSPAVDRSGLAVFGFEKVVPGLWQVVAAVLSVAAVIFAALFWQATRSVRDIQQENVGLQRALDEQQASDTQGVIQMQQQLGNYRTALDSTYAVALGSIEWAANQASLYGFNETPLGDSRLAMIADLSEYLVALGFNGLVRIETHVGNYCMTFTGTGAYAVAAADLPAQQCDQIGFDASDAYQQGLQQSAAFANFMDLADDRTDGRIRYEIVSMGNTNPLMNYPASSAGTTASAWNEIAASNNRVDVSLYPDTPNAFID